MNNTNQFLIRLKTWEKGAVRPTVIKAYYTNIITEVLKLYITAKEYEIPINIPNEGSLASKYDGGQCYVEDIVINFGNDICLMGLDIYVEVF